jgi:AraC-like DNA-binding protein
VAETIGTSVRTLQRRMQTAGLTYGGVVQQTRCAAAQQMLIEEPGRKISDVAHAVGYSDPAHFTRAFRRWMGIGPREFRRRGRTALTMAGPCSERRASRLMPRGLVHRRREGI